MSRWTSGRAVRAERPAGTIAARLCEAMAQVMTSPDVLKAFETSGSLVAYQDAPAFSQFIAADSSRLIAAVKKIGKVE
jgi:tripartite-type tricarboxylate transporter receptor subunit TctC